MPYIFLHGLGQTPAHWDAALRHLPELAADARCPNLPDLLRGQPVTYPALFDAFSAWCGAQPGALHLCGLSLGAVLALDYAAAHPARVQSLVLIAGQARMPQQLLRLQDAVLRCLPRACFGQTGLPKPAFLQLTRSMTGLDLTPQLSALTCPVSVICGTRDWVNRRAARALAAGIPGAALTWIPAAGHTVNEDAPQALAGHLRAWYRQV